MGDSRQAVARDRVAAVMPLPLDSGRRGILREAGPRKVINPEMLEPILRHTEDYAEGMITRRLTRIRDEFGPDVADAAAEGIIRGLTIHAGGGKEAFDLFTDAANAAIEPALKTNISS